MIYFIKSESGQVKIGHTNNPIEIRLKSMQTGCPFNLKLIKTIEGDTLQESLIHKKFKKYRFRGEWFNMSEELTSFINNPVKIESEKKDAKKKVDIKFEKDSLQYLVQKYMKENKFKLRKLSISSGVSESILSRFLSGKRSLSWKSAEKLIKIVG